MQTETGALRELFDAVVALPPGDRAAWLDRRCPDAALRARVEQLLVADATQTELLGGASAEQLAEAMAEGGDGDDSYAWTPGTLIGPFELLEVLGEGGSSTVYRAQREVDGITQAVALKVLHRGLHTADAQRRFRSERKALVQLRHPGIARMIEGGITDEGLGFIAMELVDGVPITEYARQTNMELRGRLRLFLRVCTAVAAAHRALIVHRDLKPAHVLVTVDGEIKLLDFGIAKLLTDDDTHTAFPAFTPAYAAPEQRSGAEATTATDVYALGVVLGELITGKRLDGSSGKTPSREVPDLAPAGVLPASPAATRRLLRGDLGTMLLKALEPEPEHRYASADALGEDVRNLLDGRPVNAHPPSRWYRTRKFVARHKGGVAISAIFLLAIFAALGLAVWQADVARHQARRADSARDFLLDVFDAARPAGPRLAPPSVTDVVRAAVAEAQRSASLEQSVRIELVATLGSVLRSQGELDDSVALLEANYRDAVDTLGAEHAVTLQVGLALASAYADAGAQEPARRTLDALLRQGQGADAGLRARILAQSAAVGSHQFEQQRALAESAAAVKLCRTGSCDPQTRSQVLLVRGNTLAGFHDDAAAIASMQQALALQRQLHGGPHVDIADTLQQLSRAERRLGNLARAEQLARESLAIVEASVPDPHQLHAQALDTLRQILIDRHKLDEAIVLGERVIAVNIATLGPRHPGLATSYNTQGYSFHAAGRYPEAIARYRAALAISEPIAANARRTAVYRSNLGDAIGLGDDPQAGIAMIRQAIDELRAQAEPDLSEICASLEKIGRLQRDQGDLAGAEGSYLQADAIYRQSLKTAPSDWRAVALIGLGRTLADAGNDGQAARYLRQALAMELKPVNVVSHSRIEAKAALAEVLYRGGQMAAARELLVEANAEAAGAGSLRPYLTRLLHRASSLIGPTP